MILQREQQIEITEKYNRLDDVDQVIGGDRLTGKKSNSSISSQSSDEKVNQIMNDDESQFSSSDSKPIIKSIAVRDDNLGQNEAQNQTEMSYDTAQVKRPASVKRDDYLIWEDYFMSVALLSARRCKDPSTQVGACIVNNDNKIVSISYNGMPINCNDDLLPWGKDSPNELENKYLYICHAELNSVLNCNTFRSKGCIIYVTLFACYECAKIQSGIKKIYYLDEKKEEKPEHIASKRLLNVKLVHYRPKEKEVVLRLQI